MLCRDLCKWDTMYAAGRLQKPVLHLKSDGLVQDANEKNLASALVASLLLLPKHFSMQVRVQDSYRLHHYAIQLL